jgi:predicted metal-dependent hydrolase
MAKKDQALALVQERINYYSSIYNFPYGKISIRNQKTRWGSCSRKGDLSFNYKIIYLPKNLADYIIVHELCHLKEFNHSRKFWNLVALAFPDYKKLRAQISKM